MAAIDDEIAREKSIFNEQRKYQSTYLNTIAAGFIVAGVIASIVTAVKGDVPPVVLVLVPVWIILSAGLHYAAVVNLERLK
jgi:hypothetical protein